MGSSDPEMGLNARFQRTNIITDMKKKNRIKTPKRSKLKATIEATVQQLEIHFHNMIAPLCRPFVRSEQLGLIASMK